MTVDIERIAHDLDTAACAPAAISQISASCPSFSVEDAYAVQAASIGRRFARGERMLGVKMGFTSRAKMIQMGLKDQIWGRLTSAMMIENGGALRRSRFIHPRAEPELAVRLKAPLAGAVSADEAWGAVGEIAPAIEIIDSRYRDFKFSLPDVIADNASSSAFVVGTWRQPDIDVSDLKMVMCVDGAPLQSGSTADILGHPARSLAAAARLAGGLEEGWIVLLGGATSAEAIGSATRVSLEAEKLGAVAFGVEGGRP